MEKHYKKLMNSKSSKVARFIDSLFILIIVIAISFSFSLVQLKNLTASLIIAFNVGIITIFIMAKLNSIRIVKFKKQLDNSIKNKLILEGITFSPNIYVNIRGYKHVKDNVYIDEQQNQTLLIREYPQSLLKPKELLKYLDKDYKKIIATCDFDDDCYLLCSRMEIELLNKTYLLNNINVRINQKQIQCEIEKEVKEIAQIKKNKKSAAFAKEKWSKYFLTALLLIGVSVFMGRFKIIYIAFGGMCMTFCFFSLMHSKPQ